MKGKKFEKKRQHQPGATTVVPYSVLEGQLKKLQQTSGNQLIQLQNQEKELVELRKLKNQPASHYVQQQQARFNEQLKAKESTITNLRTEVEREKKKTQQAEEGQTVLKKRCLKLENELRELKNPTVKEEEEVVAAEK